MLVALGAVDGNFDALSHTGGLRGGDGGEAFILGLLARLAALRFVLQSLVMKEDLLPGRPDEILTAVDTVYGAILEFHLRMAPLSIGSARCVCL